MKRDLYIYDRKTSKNITTGMCLDRLTGHLYKFHIINRSDKAITKEVIVNIVNTYFEDLKKSDILVVELLKDSIKVNGEVRWIHKIQKLMT